MCESLYELSTTRLADYETITTNFHPGKVIETSRAPGDDRLKRGAHYGAHR
jgi:hypothetical protein